MVYARKGEHVTCENGHHICTVANDLPAGTIQDPSALAHWRQAAPVPGTMAHDAPCVICGALWFGGPNGTDGWMLHFADGWRGRGFSA